MSGPVSAPNRPGPPSSLQLFRRECEALTGRPMPGKTLGWEFDLRPAAWTVPAAAADPMTARGPAVCWPDGAPAQQTAHIQRQYVQQTCKQLQPILQCWLKLQVIRGRKIMASAVCSCYDVPVVYLKLVPCSGADASLPDCRRRTCQHACGRQISCWCPRTKSAPAAGPMSCKGRPHVPL